MTSKSAALYHCTVLSDLSRSLSDVCMHVCVCVCVCVSYACNLMFPAMSPACVEPRRQEKLKRPRPTFDKPMNEGLERFKFWLGLPNQYYQDDWQSRGE